MSNKSYNVAVIISTFLTLLASTLEAFFLDVKIQKRDIAAFKRDWYSESRISYIDAIRGSLRFGWLSSI